MFLFSIRFHLRNESDSVRTPGEKFLSESRKNIKRIIDRYPPLAFRPRDLHICHDTFIIIAGITWVLSPFEIPRVPNSIQAPVYRFRSDPAKEILPIDVQCKII